MAMTSFNSLNRIPSSGNKWLMRDVLRGEMGFEGVLISDYSAIEEMVCHGIAEDSKEAALLAIRAGVDIDMMSNCYVKHLVDLVREGTVSETLVDEAVWRILTLKNNLGLFENPYKDLSVEKEKELNILIQKAVVEASVADKVILCIGDDRLQSGEGHSKTNISIPKNQLKMMREIAKVNKNIVTLVFSGRPVLLQEILELSKAVMMDMDYVSEPGLFQVFIGSDSDTTNMTEFRKV